MHRSKLFIILHLAAISMLPVKNTSAQSTRHTDLEDCKKAIAASNEIYFQAFEKNDTTLFISRYAEDCWIMPANAPIACGSRAAGDFFRRAYDKFGVRGGKFTTVDVYGVTDGIVAEIGFWKSYDAANTEFDDGKYLVLWKKTANGWKMWRDSFSSDHLRK